MPGQGVLFAAILIAAVMSAVGFFTGPQTQLSGRMGLCLPSPNLWPLIPEVSWTLNLAFIVLTAFGLYLANKAYTFIPNPSIVVISAFVVMCCSNPWISGMLTSSVIMAAVNLYCISLTFGSFKERNASQCFFLIATMLSIGSMFQYAFVFMAPVYIAIGITLKCFRFRELLALLMGLVAPYWVSIGLGLIPPESINIPTFTNLFEGYSSKMELFSGTVNLSVTALFALLFGLNNLVKLYAGNSRRRLFNTSLNLMGIACVAMMAIDFNNMTAYMATFYMIAAVQFANVFALWNVKSWKIWLPVAAALYVGFFTASVA